MSHTTPCGKMKSEPHTSSGPQCQGGVLEYIAGNFRIFQSHPPQGRKNQMKGDFFVVIRCKADYHTGCLQSRLYRIHLDFLAAYYCISQPLFIIPLRIIGCKVQSPALFPEQG